MFAATGNPKVFLRAAVCAAVLLAFGAGTVRADVQLTRRKEGDRELYVLSNDLLSAVIDPADGGCVRRLELFEGGPDLVPADGECTLAQDVVEGGVCRYSVESELPSAADYAPRSRSVATLSLSWQSSDALRVHKSFSLLESELTVRVGYRIENGSQQAAVLNSRSVLSVPTTEPTELRAMGAEGLQTATMERLWSGGPLLLNDVRWACTAGLESQQGLLITAGAGMWESVEVLFSAEDRSLRVHGDSVWVPAGKLLESSIGLVPIHSVGPVVGLGGSLLCGMNVETAGRTVRIRSNVLPLADLGLQRLALSFRDKAGQELKTLSTGALKLSCGKPELFTFYWEAPEEAHYRCDLVLLDRPAQPAPVSFHFEPATGSVTWQDAAERTITLADVEGWERREPGRFELTEKRLVFRDSQGREITELRCHVGIGESETVLVQIEGEGTEEYRSGEISCSLTECVAELGDKKIPQGNLSVSVVAERGEDEPAAGAGRPVGLALRVSSHGVEPARYRGELRVELAHRRASLPVSVKVWPVVRPQPGLVKLHTYYLPLHPGSSKDVLPLWRKLHGHQDVALTVAPDQLWYTEWVRLLDSGLPLRSPAAEAFPPLDAASLPRLDFSAMDPWIDDLILMGAQDFVLLMELTREQVGPRLWDRNRIPIPWESTARWFWEEFTIYVRGKGFRNLYVISPRVLGAQDMGWDWFKCASVLAECGWSVCGPYGRSALERVSASAVSGLGDLLLFDESAEEIIRDTIKSTEAASGQPIKVGRWLPPLDLSSSASEAQDHIWRAWRTGVSLLCQGSVKWRGRPYVGPPVTEGPTAAQALESTAWEGVRDGLDEVNYLAVLDWYLREMESGALQPPEASELAGKIRGKLDALCSKRPAVDRERAGRPPRPLDKERVLEMLQQIRAHVQRVPRRLYWHDVLLVDGAAARMEIVMQRDQPAQMAQAQVLRGIIRMHTDVSVPLVAAEDFSPLGGKPIAIVLAGDVLNPVLKQVLTGRADRAAELALRLRRSKHMIVEVRPDGGDRERYLFLMGADEEHLARAVMNFKMKLRQEGGWLLRPKEAGPGTPASRSKSGSD